MFVVHIKRITFKIINKFRKKSYMLYLGIIFEMQSLCPFTNSIRITSSNLFGKKNIKNIHLQLFLIQNLFDPNEKKLTGPIFPS